LLQEAALHTRRTTGPELAGQGILERGDRHESLEVRREALENDLAPGGRREPPRWVNEGFAAFFEKFIGHLDPQGNLTFSFGYFSNWRFPITKAMVEDLSLREDSSNRRTLVPTSISSPGSRMIGRRTLRKVPFALPRSSKQTTLSDR
jgi:hypothetical protein